MKFRSPGRWFPDQELKAALKQAIDHRNIPGAAEASRWISIRVRNGIVTLSGHANESTVTAVSIAVAKTPGVRDLILRLLVYSDTLPTKPVEWPPAGASVGGISTQ